MIYHCYFTKSLIGDGVGSVSPNTRIYSQSYPSIYSSPAAIGQPVGLHGNGEHERAMEECEKARERTDIVDLEEEDEEEEDERRHNLNESAGMFMCQVLILGDVLYCCSDI